MNKTTNKVFLAIGDRCWAKGATEQEAIKKMMKEGGFSRKPKEYLIYLVDPTTRVDEMGGLCFKSDGPRPILLKRVEGGKEQVVELSL